jgi:nucleotide-binding universal stress UspA family protein
MNAHILFPTDFSEAAQHAFDYTVKLAEALDTQIDLMSVYHLPVGDASRITYHQIDEMLRQRQGEVMKKLNELADSAPAKRIGQMRVDYGMFVYQEIVDVASKNGHQLIAMGTKGERNAFEKLLGSVTTHTMMNAPCPVLAIPMDAQYSPVKNIAYATNFEPSDEQAIEKLNGLSEELKAKLHFLHVDTAKKYGLTEHYVMVEDYPRPFSDFSVINHESATEGIDEYLKDHDIDWLALFLPDRKFWERLLHRSFTKRMTFHSKVPTLVFGEG